MPIKAQPVLISLATMLVNWRGRLALFNANTAKLLQNHKPLYQTTSYPGLRITKIVQFQSFTSGSTMLITSPRTELCCGTGLRSSH